MTTVLGPIVRLQVQRNPLKRGEKPNRRYTPDDILPVQRALIDADGMVGWAEDREVIDVHNRRHPETRNNDGRNSLSVGFTAHYRAIIERYGEHVTPGCAGENILVEIDRMISLDEVARGFVILSHTRTPLAELVDVTVAHPCKPFSGFVHRHETVAPETLKATLQFLDDGMRGFYCSTTSRNPVAISVGDWVAVS